MEGWQYKKFHLLGKLSVSVIELKLQFNFKNYRFVTSQVYIKAGLLRRKTEIPYILLRFCETGSIKCSFESIDCESFYFI